MEKITYFEKPTQVIWIDEEGTKHAGIAYCDEIICACCGGIQEIEEVYEYCPEGMVAIQVLDWIDISEEIGGDWTINEEEEDA